MNMFVCVCVCVSVKGMCVRVHLCIGVYGASPVFQYMDAVLGHGEP